MQRGAPGHQDRPAFARHAFSLRLRTVCCARGRVHRVGHGVRPKLGAPTATSFCGCRGPYEEWIGRRCGMSAESLQRARAGDRDAFTALVGPYRSELHVHCYRMLGSLQDAEDALQETLLAAWLGLEGFEGRSSVRTWLYRIATNRCLNVLRSSGRRPVAAAPLPIAPPEPTRMGE